MFNRTIRRGPSFVSRQPGTVKLFDETELTLDGGWWQFDLAAFIASEIPQDATALLVAITHHATAGLTFEMGCDGNLTSVGIVATGSLVKTDAGIITLDDDLAVDSKIAYLGDAGAWTRLDVYLRGFWL